MTIDVGDFVQRLARPRTAALAAGWGLADVSFLFSLVHLLIYQAIFDTNYGNLAFLHYYLELD